VRRNDDEDRTNAGYKKSQNEKLKSKKMLAAFLIFIF